MSDALNAPISPTTTPTTTPTTPPTTPTGSWASSITDAEIVGHLQNRGWDKLTPDQAAIEAVKAHRGVEKLVGAPPDQMLRIPRADDEAGQKAFWARLGAPEKPEDYTFEGIEFDDPEWQAGFTDAIRDVASKLHMPKEMAQKVAARIFKFASDKGAAQEASVAAQQAAAKQELIQEWGPEGSARFNANRFVSDKAVDALGITDKQLDAMANSMGRVETAKLFHRIGQALGEDKFVAGQNSVTSGVMTREQAVARKAELMADREWGQRLFNGGANEKKEFDALMQIISSSA